MIQRGTHSDSSHCTPRSREGTPQSPAGARAFRGSSAARGWKTCATAPTLDKRLGSVNSFVKGPDGDRVKPWELASCQGAARRAAEQRMQRAFPFLWCLRLPRHGGLTIDTLVAAAHPPTGVCMPTHIRPKMRLQCYCMPEKAASQVRCTGTLSSARTAINAGLVDVEGANHVFWSRCSLRSERPDDHAGSVSLQQLGMSATAGQDGATCSHYSSCARELGVQLAERAGLKAGSREQSSCYAWS